MSGGRRVVRGGEGDVLDTVQPCALLDVSEPVLRDAMRRRGLPYRRVGSKVLRYSGAALIAWVAAGRAEDDARDSGLGMA